MRKDIDSSSASPPVLPTAASGVPGSRVPILVLLGIVLGLLGGSCAKAPPPEAASELIDPPGVIDAGPPRRVGDRYLFALTAPGARSVALSGSFNGWVPGGHPMKRQGDLWWTLVELRRGRHRYKFVLDGTTWITDPENPRQGDDGAGGRASLVDVR